MRRSSLGALVACALLTLGFVAAQEPARDRVPPSAPSAPDRPAPRDLLPSDAWWTEDREGRAALFERVARRVEELYWDPEHLDWEAWRARHREAVVDADGPASLDRAFRRMFGDLDDDHSRWLGAEGGAPGPAAPDGPEPGPPTTRPELGATVHPLETRGLLVLRVHPGGAAEAAGLRRGDVIVAVRDASLAEAGAGRAMRRLLASALDEGSSALEIERGRSRHAAVIEPRALPPGAPTRPALEIDDDLGTARLEIPSFSSGTAARVHEELASLSASGVRHLVLDLRGNPGGSVVDMGLVLGAFTDGEPVAAHGPTGVAWRLRIDRDDGLRVRLARPAPAGTGSDVAAGRLDASVRWDGPIAVLVDGGTASAAEALAGALAAEGAIVVGEETPGNVETIRRVTFPGGRSAMVALGDLRRADGAPLAPVPLDAVRAMEPSELARGLDAPYAEAARRLRGLAWLPGRWF